MLVSIIAAMDRRGLIGDETGLPCALPRDLRRFRATTWGKPIVMGRRTFELLGKPLPGRFNIVLTRNSEYIASGCRIARTLQEALSAAEDYATNTGCDEGMIIGGGKVYAEAMDRWDRLYLTLVEGQFGGNTYFPVRELLQQKWRPVCAGNASPGRKESAPALLPHHRTDWGGGISFSSKGGGPREGPGEAGSRCDPGAGYVSLTSAS